MSAFPEEDNVFLERNLRDESVSDHYAAETSWTDRLEQPKSKAINKDIDLEEAVNKINYLWVLISCGYMVSWTSIGSCGLSHNCFDVLLNSFLPLGMF